MAQLVIDLPDEFAAQAAAVVRDRYPALAGQGLSDADVLRALLGFVVGDLLAGQAETQVRDTAESEIAARREQAQSTAQAAREQARQRVRDLFGPLPGPGRPPGPPA